MKLIAMTKPVVWVASAAALLALVGCSSESDGGSEAATTPQATATAPAAPTTPAEDSEDEANGDTDIIITAGDQRFTATLNDSQVSRDFVATLPGTLSWFRNAGIEYITELDEPMTETGPFYTDVQPGDIVYYNPLDSVTIIYEETSSVPTLTKMGEITSDLEAFRDLPDDIEMRIELA